MKDLVADSSFYLCFLDDIECPLDLVEILKKFKAHVSTRILSEISKSRRADKVKKHINIFEEGIPNLGEALRPFLTQKQIDSGESEVLILAYICFNLGISFVLVIDDKSPRKFVKMNFSYIEDELKYTSEFITDCCLLYKIFHTEKAISLLNKVKDSKFRVPEEAVIKEIKKIESYHG
jgi:hypothetical protein